jgi:hypothetical protein
MVELVSLSKYREIFLERLLITTTTTTTITTIVNCFNNQINNKCCGLTGLK